MIIFFFLLQQFPATTRKMDELQDVQLTEIKPLLTNKVSLGSERRRQAQRPAGSLKTGAKPFSIELILSANISLYARHALAAVSIIKVNYSFARVSEGEEKEAEDWGPNEGESGVKNPDGGKKASKQHLEEICLWDWWKQRQDGGRASSSSSSSSPSFLMPD